jgi:thymidylate kinase
MRYVVFEGLPAAGKSETLALLERFYSQRVRVLPELVKDVAMANSIDIWSQRGRLTEAIVAELPRRRDQIEKILAENKICLEESHLGVHLAYSHTLGDEGFRDIYPKLSSVLPSPDAYVRLDIPIEVSLLRQEARNTPSFFVNGPQLEEMLSKLQAWHIQQATNLILINANREPSAFLSEVEKTVSLDYVTDNARLDETLDILLLLGRPASGKSEFIDFMRKTPLSQRARKYKIAAFNVWDDFPILWDRCVDDDLWESLGRKRMYSRRVADNYAIAGDGVWAFLTGKLNQQLLDVISQPEALNGRTAIVEFSRGGEHGYSESLSQLSPNVLSRAAILYVNVSFEESRRRNVERYDETNKSGILTHSVPREEMEKTYAYDDWAEITKAPYGVLTVGGIDVPYVTMNNEPESTDPQVLGPRYAAALELLHDLWRRRS